MSVARRLTWRGFQRKQFPIALQMLKAYGIEPHRIRLVSSSTNFIYRLGVGTERFILRLAFPGWRSPEDAQAEAAWLAALARDTDIPVPRLLLTRDGEAVARMGNRHAVLMTWLPGTLMGKRLTEANLQKTGELFARLHVHAASWTRPPDFPEKRFDRFLSRGETEALFSDARLADYIPADLVTVRGMAERVNAHYDALDPADLRVIHCDLWHDNIKLHRGRLLPFDFEDTILGYRLHDIAMAMLDLAEDTDTESYYDRLLPAFRAGYESLLPWPVGSLETLQMGRVLWRLNWVANRIPSDFPAAARFNAELFRRFENTGRLVDPLRA